MARVRTFITVFCVATSVVFPGTSDAARVVDSQAEWDLWALSPVLEDFETLVPTGNPYQTNVDVPVGEVVFHHLVPAGSTANYRLLPGTGDPSVNGSVQVGGQLDATPLSTLLIKLPEPVYAAGFDYAFRATFSEGGVIRVAGVEQDFANRGDIGFVGVVSSTPFDTLEVECDRGSFSAFALDNVVWSAAPPPDDDGDGFLGPAAGGADCDDTDPDTYPGATEICGDGVDNDCDGTFPLDEFDLDGDGQAVCEGDCDDFDAAVASALTESCDGIDNDCDHIVDDGTNDGDGDGVCDALDACPLDLLDDDDGDGICDSDDVCPGGHDDHDVDGDGIANACDVCPFDAAGDSDNDGSCDSDDLCTGDDATGDDDLDGVCGDLDVCPRFNDHLDADGDAIPDGCDPCPSNVDSDGDGACESIDCDDTDPTTFPGAAETCDGIDNDCDGLVPLDELDLDADGHLACGTDCDDLDADISPDDTEVCNGIDDNCDGTADAGLTDTDGDGTCDALDTCPGDANDDSDGDGICDSVDWCLGNDWSGDLDLDGVCSDTDPCPVDVDDDSDGDGSCDSDDLCEGDDIAGDADADGRCDPLLTIEQGVPRDTLIASVSYAQPGSQVFYLLSASGDDGDQICHPRAPVCTTLAAFQVIHSGEASLGDHSFTAPGLLVPGATLWFQAVWIANGDGQTTPVVEFTVPP